MPLTRAVLWEMAEFIALDGTLLVSLYFGVVFVLAVLQQGSSGRGLMRKLEVAPLLSGSFLAAVAGAVTPFCSCSTVPIVNGLVRANVPFGICMSFLLASPLVDEAAVIMMISYFGAGYAVIFVVSSIIVPTGLGLAFHALGFARFLKSTPRITEPAGFAGEDAGQVTATVPWRARVRFGALLARSELKLVAKHLVAGVLIGAVIQGLVPESWIREASHSMSPSWQVLFMAMIGIPLYLNVIGALPIAAALVAKGMPLGPVSAFLITAVGISVPELTLLSRLFRAPLMAAYVSAVFVCAIAIGFAVG